MKMHFNTCVYISWCFPLHVSRGGVSNWWRLCLHWSKHVPGTVDDFTLTSRPTFLYSKCLCIMENSVHVGGNKVYNTCVWKNDFWNTQRKENMQPELLCLELAIVQVYYYRFYYVQWNPTSWTLLKSGHLRYCRHFICPEMRKPPYSVKRTASPAPHYLDCTKFTW